ncbi:hypothetical protein BE04_02465 [Sorangium cellulosum]|uniref:Uncharacterized protein n=2 Tax=Sorangium cellulosum TaxID=56 RepID=A0A150PXA5_SORCE|nr:hypothetical protein [Sorangium cellulosum]AGP40798.1 hypothetical protein SCE1572_43715 [Sorangium cellulosum So0157-2]KYF60018.1 hypothetical protein BE04_02465 [Sorangium cellulosum]
MRSGPHFFAWCNEAARVDALRAAFSALVQDPPYCIYVDMHPNASFGATSVDEAVAKIRAHFQHADAEAYIAAALSPGESVDLILRCYSDKSERITPRGPIHMRPRYYEDLGRMRMDLALGSGPRSVEAEAEVAWHMVLDDLEDLLLRVCAPDASGRVSTGGCTSAWTWLAPVSMCATYHADARDIARDLALSWISLHDKEKVSLLAGVSLEALHARVDAAPAGARVFPRDNSGRSLALSREAVLKALAIPGSALLEALDAAAAVPDEAWRASELRANEIMHLTAQSMARGEQVTVTGKSPPVWRVEMTGEHVYFLVDHAPVHVRRLPSGGVMLATHPYRTLWPLWADALSTLGLMS